MSRKNNGEVIYIAFFVLLYWAVSIGALLGVCYSWRQHGIQEIQEEAVRRGYATWVHENNSSAKKFQWK